MTISNDNIDILEKYTSYVYFSEYNSSLDELRMKDFEFSVHDSFRLHPPSKVGLLQHIKRAAIQPGWVDYQCKENTDLPDPSEWGWTKRNGSYIPLWQDIDSPINIENVISTCSCQSKKCLNCQCAKKDVPCISFCKCHRSCRYNTL